MINDIKFYLFENIALKIIIDNNVKNKILFNVHNYWITLKTNRWKLNYLNDPEIKKQIYTTVLKNPYSSTLKSLYLRGLIFNIKFLINSKFNYKLNWNNKTLILFKKKKWSDNETLLIFIKKYASKVFNFYLNYIKDKFFFELKKYNISLKHSLMSSRFGSCKHEFQTFVIKLNRILLHYPEICLIFVIFHELTHILIPNHNDLFKKMLLKKFAYYKKANLLLKRFNFIFK